MVSPSSLEASREEGWRFASREAAVSTAGRLRLLAWAAAEEVMLNSVARVWFMAGSVGEEERGTKEPVNGRKGKPIDGK